MNTIVSQKMSRGQGNELLNALEAAGMMSDLAQKIVDSKDNDLAKKVVQLVRNGGFAAPTSHTSARAIMGRNMFGVEEAIKCYKINPSAELLACFSKIPWSEEVLQSVKDTHILVAVFPLSILDILRSCKDQRIFYNPGYYDTMSLAKNRGKVGWRLVRKTPVANSAEKTWNEQQLLLDHDEETPTTFMMIYTIVGHFLATGEKLFEHIYVRCADLDFGGGRFYVGSFGFAGLGVDCCSGDYESRNIGLSGVRKQ